MGQLADEYQQIVDDQASDWSDLYFELILPDESQLDEARLLMAPVQLERTPGTRDTFTFHVSHSRGYGAYPALAHACLSRIDTVGITGTLSLTRTLHDVRPNYTQGPA